MKNFRLVRVNELLKRVTSEYLRKYCTVESTSITITKVSAAEDLRSADVYFSVYDVNLKSKGFVILKKEKINIQRFISDEMHLKHTPRLNFVWDENLEKTNHTLDLLNEIDKELANKENI